MLSGIVTSSTKTALSLHLTEDVELGVNASEVGVDGIGVGKVKPCFVGGRVEVTKRGGASGVTDSCETLTQDVSIKTNKKVIENFLII